MFLCFWLLISAVVGLPTESTLDRRAQNSGSLSLLTYNIAGLPAIFSSGSPETSTAEIGKRIAPYDIVNVQEDFNYHATLYANDAAHAYRTATSGGAGIGSGLNSLSKYPFKDFERVKWKDCYGVFDSGTDCLTPKGFTFMRVRISEGVSIDVYNLHTDADTDSNSLNARRKNILQVLEYINTVSAGHPVIVMGDTNTRYTRDGDNIRAFTSNGFTDPWVQLTRNGSPPALGSEPLLCNDPPSNSCEIVDKIFFRSSSLVSITAVSYSNDHLKFLGSDGLRLSDHYPITATVSWSIEQSNVRISDSVGGPHGTFFNDAVTVPSDPSKVSVLSFTLRGNRRLDSVSVTRSSETLTHGGSGGTPVTLTLNQGEHVVSATISQGKTSTTRVFYMKLVTNTGRSIQSGTMTSETVTYTAPSGWRVVGFWGRSGDEVDQVGLVYARI